MSKSYTKAELEDACRAYHVYAHEFLTPSFDVWFAEWLAERNKPAKKKIIDLSPLLAPGIDSEFSDDGKKWRTGSLACIHHGFRTNNKYGESSHGNIWEKCRPRMNYKMFHDGSARPLLEGFKLRIHCRGSQTFVTSSYAFLRWVHNRKGFAADGYADVIAYEILGLADGWSYPWYWQKLS